MAQLEGEGSREVTLDRWVIYLRSFDSCWYDFLYPIYSLESTNFSKSKSYLIVSENKQYSMNLFNWTCLFWMYSSVNFFVYEFLSRLGTSTFGYFITKYDYKSLKS